MRGTHAGMKNSDSDIEKEDLVEADFFQKSDDEPLANFTKKNRWRPKDPEPSIWKGTRQQSHKRRSPLQFLTIFQIVNSRKCLKIQRSMRSQKHEKARSKLMENT